MMAELHNNSWREAERAYKKAWREKNRDKVRAYARAWARKNPEKIRQNQIRYWQRRAMKEDV